MKHQDNTKQIKNPLSLLIAKGSLRLKHVLLKLSLKSELNLRLNLSIIKFLEHLMNFQNNLGQTTNMSVINHKVGNSKNNVLGMFWQLPLELKCQQIAQKHLFARKCLFF